MFTQKDYEYVITTNRSRAHPAREATKLRARVRYHRHTLAIANDARRYAHLPEIEHTRLGAARDVRTLTARAEQLDEGVRAELRKADNPFKDSYSTEHAWLTDEEATWDGPPDDADRGPASRVLDDAVNEIYIMWNNIEDQLHEDHADLPLIPAEAREPGEAEEIRNRLRPVAHALQALHLLTNALDRL